jgi:hypothetical protein
MQCQNVPRPHLPRVGRSRTIIGHSELASRGQSPCEQVVTPSLRGQRARSSPCLAHEEPCTCSERGNRSRQIRPR